MTTRLKTFGLMLLFVLLATLTLYLASLVAQRRGEASRLDGYSIRVRTITYGEVER